MCLTRSASGDAPADGRALLGEKDTMRTRCIGWCARGEEQPPREVGRACGRPARARMGHRDLFGRTPPPRPLASPPPRPLPSWGASWVPCTQGAQWKSQSMSVAGLESVLAGREFAGISWQKWQRGRRRGAWAGAPEWKDHLFSTLDQLRQKDQSGGSKLVVEAHLGPVASTGSGA